MMSTAVSMTFGTDQGRGNHVSEDGGDAQGTSFEESFDERIGFSSVAAEKKFAGAAVSAGQELRNAKSSSPVSIAANEIVGVSDSPHGKSASKQTLPGSDENESTVPVRVPTTLIDGFVRPQRATNDGGVVNLTIADKPAAEVESSDDRDVSGVTVAVETKDESFAEDRNMGFGGETIVPSGDGTSIKRNSLDGKAEPVASAKKTVKAHAPEIAKPSESKSVAVVQHPVVVALAKTETLEAAPSTVVVAVGLNVAEVASNQTVQSESEEAAAGAVAKPFADRLTTGGEGPAQRNVTRDAKPVNGGLPATNAGDSVAPQQLSVGEEKSSEVTVSVKDDGGDRTLSMPAPAMAIVHATGGGVGIVQGAGPDAFSLRGTQGEGSVSKLQNAEKVASGVGLQAETAAPEVFGGLTSIDGAPHMLSATPTTLEVGIQNGTHGWLKVRAEMTDGGAVSATVSAATSAGQEMLHRELPAITAYLQQEKLAVSSVAVHTAAATGADSKEYSEGRQSDGDPMSQRGDQGGGERQHFERDAPNATDEIATYERSNGVGVGGHLNTGTYAVGGNWLSVRA